MIFFPVPKENETFLIKKVYLTRQKRLAEYTIEDLRLMIGQKQGLDYLVPLALNHLEEDPFVEGDFYEGDLLVNVLKCQCEFWKSHASNIKRMNEVVQLVADRIEDIDLLEDIKQSILSLIEKYKHCISNTNLGL
nr:contact-dependent growth inhibition system immunity protein [Chitinophaga sp. GbtcB8]